MTTLIVQGYVTPPSGPDTSPGFFGYDNAGFFGPRGASLADLPFSVTWTGTACNCDGGPNTSGNPVSPVTDATLTINGVTVDLAATGTIVIGQWFNDHILGATPSHTLLTYSTNVFTFDGGYLSLQNPSDVAETNAYLTITNFNGIPVPVYVPGPIVGTGWPALALIAAILTYRLFASRRLSSRQPASAAA
jgi:hypothetical protein